MPANNETFEKKVDQIKNDIENMVEKVLQALAGLNAAASLGLFLFQKSFYICKSKSATGLELFTI